MSDANRVLLSYINEGTYGVFPSGPPTLKDLRMTSEDLKQNNGSTQSNELRADRQTADVIRQSISAGGPVNIEFSYGAYDDWLQYLLQSSGWSSPVSNAITITVTDIAGSAGDYPRLVRASGSFISDGYVANQWIRIVDPNTAANAVYAKLVTVAALYMEVIPANASGDLTTDAAATSTTIVMGSQIVNGTTLTTLALERHYQDLSGKFAQFTGMGLDTFSLDTNVEGILTGSFGLVGKRETSASSTGGDGSNTAAASNPVMNAVDNVVAVLEAAGVLGVTGIGMNVANNLRARQQVGNLGAINLASGNFQWNGRLSAYFANATLIDKFLNDSTSSLSKILEDSSPGAEGWGNAYVFDLPRVKYTDGKRSGGGLNQDVLVDMQYTAYRHPTEGITSRIVRFPAA